MPEAITQPAESRLTRKTAIEAMPRIIAGSQRIALKTAELGAAINAQQIILQGIAEVIATDGQPASQEVAIPPEAYAVHCDFGQETDLDQIISNLLRIDPSLTESDALDLVFQAGITTLKNTMGVINGPHSSTPIQFYPSGSLK